MKHFWRNWRVEIILVVALALGLFLLLERITIRAALIGWAGDLLSATGVVLRSAAGLFLPRSLSDFFGFLLITGVVVLAVRRVRWRLMNSPSLTAKRCPKCGSSLHRVHRTPIDRAISRLFVPVHRYLCSKPECRWRGLRVDSSKRLPQPTEVAASSDH